ncbi:hypothetical protein GGR52DRAFT_564390 [Hypoxylon sp. FL1284]|nr:hypothetical protein GGR52DRAFT_564390 [Hypoxylon sp. FL1284]
MNEALCSILCREEMWCYDTEGRSIRFNEDGSGELWCRCNFNYWITAEFEWKSIESLPESTKTAVMTSDGGQNGHPQLLGQLHLQITLLKRLPSRVQGSVLKTSTMINEHSLTDDAFRPKLFIIRIEKGNFIEPNSIGCFPAYGKSRFAMRLLFDTSPYPPRSEWRAPEKGPDDGQFWTHVEFVGRSFSELAKQGRAMNEVIVNTRSGCVIF